MLKNNQIFVIKIHIIFNWWQFGINLSPNIPLNGIQVWENGCQISGKNI